MKPLRIMITAARTSASMLLLQAAYGKQGVKRTDLQQHDLSIPGRAVIQVRVDIAPGVVAAKHTHAAEDSIYVLEGALEDEHEGKPPVTVKASDILFIPYAVPHSGKTAGS